MNSENKDQSAKADAGKAPLSLVPMQIVWDIARVREYGNRKYNDPDNWRTVEVGRYWDAFLRHVLTLDRDLLLQRDEESGLPHLWHAACNLSFILALEEGAEQDDE